MDSARVLISGASGLIGQAVWPSFRQQAIRFPASLVLRRKREMCSGTRRSLCLPLWFLVSMLWSILRANRLSDDGLKQEKAYSREPSFGNT